VCQGQLCNEEAPAHARAPRSRVRRVREGICGEQQAQATPTCSYWRETLSGDRSFWYRTHRNWYRTVPYLFYCVKIFHVDLYGVADTDLFRVDSTVR